MKTYPPYGRYITGWCVGGFAFLYACVLALCYMLITRVQDGWQVATLFLLMLWFWQSFLGGMECRDGIWFSRKLMTMVFTVKARSGEIFHSLGVYSYR